MTQPDTFNDFAAALRMKEVIAKTVREEMSRQRPPARYGKVNDFNRFTFTAEVLFPGDVETTRVKFSPSLQPKRRIVADGDFADVVRVEGVPGNFWITAITNGSSFSDGNTLHLPSLRGGSFMHQQVAKFFGGSVGDLPALGEAWYVGKWTNGASFGGDGLAHLEVVVRHTFFTSVTKKYEIAVRSNDTQGSWKKCAPVFDSGPWADNDFELEIKCGGESVELRVRRTKENTGGFTPAGYNVDVWFYGEDWEKDYTATPAVTADPAPTRFHGTTSTPAEAKGPFLSPAMAVTARAQHLLQGGGAITYTTAFGPILKWTARFMVIGLGRSHMAFDGFFDIPVPVGGVSIPVYSRSGSIGATTTLAGGVNLDNWESLYYELPWGAGSAGIEANFRIVHYNGDNFQVPSHWVHVATKLADATGFSHVALGTGEIIDVPRVIGLAAGYGNQGFPWANAAYRAMQGNRVELEGVVKATAAKAVNTGCATLPVHYRPSSSKLFMVKSSIAAGFTNVVVHSSGIVEHAAALAINDWFSLDGISFARGQ